MFWGLICTTSREDVSTDSWTDEVSVHFFKQLSLQEITQSTWNVGSSGTFCLECSGQLSKSTHTSFHPLGRETVFSTVTLKSYRCYHHFLMTAAWYLCAGLGIPGLILMIDQDVVNSALISLRANLLFTLWTLSMNGCFPDNYCVFCSLICGMLLVCTAVAFVDDPFCIKSCNFPQWKFCFYWRYCALPCGLAGKWQIFREKTKNVLVSFPHLPWMSQCLWINSIYMLHICDLPDS